MSEQTVEELMRSCSRAELDKMAEALGLNSVDYPSKRSIAEAILKTREEQRERKRIEKERGGRIQELKKKMTEDTVKGKIVAIKVTADKMQKSVASLQSDIKATAEKMQEGVKELQAGVKEQMNENREAVAANQAGVQELVNKYQAFAKELQSRVVAMQTSIKEQVNENQEYVKDFYG